MGDRSTDYNPCAAPRNVSRLCRESDGDAYERDDEAVSGGVQGRELEADPGVEARVDNTSELGTEIGAGPAGRGRRGGRARLSRDGSRVHLLSVWLAVLRADMSHGAPGVRGQIEALTLRTHGMAPPRPSRTRGGPLLPGSREPRGTCVGGGSARQR